MRWSAVAVSVVLVAGCSKSQDDPPPRPIPRAVAPVRGAAGDDDLRLLLADLASTRACAMIEGQFRELRSPKDRDVVTGVLWIRGCRITNSGTKLTLHIEGNGWQWAHEKKHRAGATFVVKQYLMYQVSATVPGALDVAYDRGTHVASVWFTPTGTPDIEFTGGHVDVDRKGPWSSVVGELGSTFSDSPEHIAKHQAHGEGTHEFQTQLAEGLAVTIDLCTGLGRFNLGRPPKGAMQPPDAGESMQVPVSLAPGGMVMFGPQPAPHGMTVDVEVKAGPVRVSLACAADASLLAEQYIASGGEMAAIPLLASSDVTTKKRVRIGHAPCPVVMIAQSLAPKDPVTFAWERPAPESARSTGGPILACK
jgi:hypothetical protein